jgi:quinol monooxygenase YgiN
MLIVTGSVRARREHVERVLELSLEHVHRSRQERGCLLHSVHRDVEDPNRLVFLEHWADADALRAHFAVPASIAFVREAAALAVDAPEVSIYEAQPVSV